jgi:ABC-type antimicrobial peptide transport system ATPase subunit
MKKSKYIWRLGSLAKDIDPTEAVNELERIENVYGSLTAENILEASKGKRSLLHRLFNWDNESAANQYRLQQARLIINNIEIIIISDGQPRQMPVYEIITKDSGRVYKSIEEFTIDDAEQIRRQAVKEINIWKNKLEYFSQFNKATKKLNEAVTLLN